MSAAMARQMMTVVKDGDGLGLFLKGSGANLEAGHNGRDEGFDALFVVYPEAGRAAAIMINTNDDGGSVRRVLDAVKRQYKWAPDLVPPAPPVAVAPKQLDRYAGHYDMGNGNMLAFAVSAGRFYTMANDFPDDELVALATDRFRTPDGLVEVRFHDDAVDMIGGPERKTLTAPRVAPLLHTLAAHADPAPALTAKVLASLQEIGAGKASADAFLTPGLRHDLGAPYTPIAGLRAITYVDGWKLTKPIERHGGKVERIAVYRTPDLKPSFVFVYITADGKVTDFDQVAD
jgi:hypothetical protein